jgi:hypothetical protein
MNFIVPFKLASFLAALAQDFAEEPIPITLAPSDNSNLAVSIPIPDVAPVSTTCLSLNIIN